MRLGVLSDTHGRAAIARAAIELLVAEGCEQFVHCGDVGPGVCALLPTDRTAVVYGNNDDPDELRHDAGLHGVQYLGGLGELTLAGRVVAVTHGDQHRLWGPIVADPTRHDYLLTGHTHVPHDLRVGRLRRVNPGALHRATRKTVAVIDLATDELRLIEVK